MHQKQSGLKLKLRSTLVNNDEKKMAIGERIIHEKTYFEPQMTLNQHGIVEFTSELLRKQFKSFTKIETIKPGNRSDIFVVSGHYSGHFSFQKYEENKEFIIEPNDVGFQISWDSELYLCIQISFRRSNLLFSNTQVNRICPTFAKFISQRKNIQSLVKMVYLGKHTKLSENIVPERSPASVNRIRFIVTKFIRPYSAHFW